MAAAPLLLLLLAFVGIQMMSRRRRVETHKAMLVQLAPGDEVVTSGGLIGRVVEVLDQEVRVEFAPGTVVRVAKAAIIGQPARSESAVVDSDAVNVDLSNPHDPEDAE